MDSAPIWIKQITVAAEELEEVHKVQYLKYRFFHCSNMNVYMTYIHTCVCTVKRKKKYFECMISLLEFK